MNRPRASHLLFASALIGAAGGTACFDPQNLDNLVYGVDEADVWKDGAKVPTPAAPGERRLLISNNLDDTVSVVSYARLLQGHSDAELSRFPVGLSPIEREGPHHLDVDRDGRFAYVGISNFVPGGGSGPHGIHGSGTADGRALRIDLDNERTVDFTRVDKNPGDIRLTPQGDMLVMSHFDLVKVESAAALGVFEGEDVDARLAFVEPTSMTRLALPRVCPAPHGMGFTSDSKTIVTSCLSDEAAIVDVNAAIADVAGGGDGSAGVTRVDVIDGPGTAAAPNCSPYAVTMAKDDAVAWVSCYASGDVVAINVAEKTRGPSVALPGLAVFGDVNDAGDALAVAVQDTDGVAVFAVEDDHALRLTKFITVDPEQCTLPHTVRFFDDDGVMAVVCEGNKIDPGSVIVLDDAGDVVGHVVLGNFPDDLAVQEKPVLP